MEGTRIAEAGAMEEVARGCSSMFTNLISQGYQESLPGSVDKDEFCKDK